VRSNRLLRQDLGFQSGFTLVELLVVIGIIALLVGVLLPTLQSAQRSARVIQCASNIKQIVTALTNYTVHNKGAYPSYYTSAPTTAWCDDDVIGPYLPGPLRTIGKAMGGGVFVCPEDDRSRRSYAMNLWMVSGTMDSGVVGPTPRGALWGSTTFRRSTQIILITERWSTHAPSPTPAILANPWYFAPPVIGGFGSKPGLRFGMGTGVFLQNSQHWGSLNCELPYMFHRRKGDGGRGTQNYGRVNIGYVDGHVELKSATDLANRQTTLSTLDSWWSPWDEQQNQ
jgi:prepilin-type N-terminal cleavage/methylation domain-containing protein/prepilin-type processing-associated H-X9-DG protein